VKSCRPHFIRFCLSASAHNTEIALTFKGHGNELYTQKSFPDAIHAYTQGLEAGPKDPEIRITLLNNRAAAYLALRPPKYQEVLKDTSAIIALSAANPDKSKRDPPPKALFRSAQALAGLGKWDEATDVIERGRKLPGEEDKKWWPTIIADVEKGKRASFERAERQRREEATEQAQKMAIAAHGLMVVTTAQPPDNPNPLHFDPSHLSNTPLYPPEVAQEWTVPLPYTPLIFPVFLLYPQHSTSDFITHFHEDTSFEDQLGPIFPASASASSPPWSDWDDKHEYYTSNLVVYVETMQRRLLKISKEITLREVLTKARRDPVGNVGRDGIVLRDGLLSFIVLPKGPEERKFIDRFKKERDGK
jgi:tetratricopeptide (TPR) repeat protein